MYLRPHSKSILTKSIRDDTAFLSSNLVMDYSLLVGVDEANHELVIGEGMKTSKLLACLSACLPV